MAWTGQSLSAAAELGHATVISRCYLAGRLELAGCAMFACLAVAWGDIKGPSSRLFGSHDQARLSPGLWLVVVLVGWCLSLDAFGWLPWDVYSMGFEPRLLWLAWGVLGLWMATAYLLPLPDGHAKAATCCLLATGLFVVTQAPSGNVWDAWLDPGLWLFAHYQWIRHGGFHRTRINHS